MWSRFGYEDEHIRRMASQDYWDAEYARIEELDPLIAGGTRGAAFRRVVVADAERC